MNFRYTNACPTLALVLALLLLSGHTGATRLEDDTFGGPVLDACRWDDWSTGGGYLTSNGTLSLATSATSAPSFPTVYSQYMLRGDFTYGVSLSAAGAWNDVIPPTDQILAYLGFFVQDGKRFFIALAKNGKPQPQILVFSQSNGTSSTLVQIPVAASSVRLQIVRIAKVLTFQFNVGNGWQTAATVANVGEDGLVSIGANSSGTPRQLFAAFSNFALTSGTSTYRSYVAQAVLPRTDFRTGVTVADYLAKRIWGPHYTAIDPLTTIAANGVGWVRAGVTTASEPSLGNTPVESWSTLPLSGGDYQRNHEPSWWSSREYTAQILKEAAAHGMRLDVFLFLSEGEASAGAQNAPSAWRGLSVADTALKVRESAFQTAQYFVSQGLNIEVYEIGNEIDFGILNFLAGDRIPLPNGTSFGVTYMTEQVWPTEAILLKAAIAGIRAAQPNAKILLHIAGLEYSPSNIMAKYFFKAMIDNGVDFDLAGLSLPYPGFPWRLDKYGATCWFQKLRETVDYIAELGKPVTLTEISYFAYADPRASPPLPEFPYTPQGEASWLRETLRFAATNPNVAGVNYFYPDGIPRPTGPGLFNPNDSPLPAVAEFAYLAQALSPPQTPQASYPLSVTESGIGGGTVTGAGINCGSTCNGTYASGTSVTLTATPAAGSTFTGWTGACANGSGTCVISMSAARSVNATFADTARNYQGLWWNPLESGWGINFAHQGDIIFATWFTYGADSTPRWYVIRAQNTSPNVYSGPVSSFTGPPFSSVPFPANANFKTLVGTAEIVFSYDGRSAAFNYTVNGITQTKQIVPQQFSPGVLPPTCAWGAQPDLTLATNYQDLWWVTDGQESGWGINFTHQGTTIFATWFTYDANGKAWWLQLVAPETAVPKVYSGLIKAVTGPPFNAEPFNPNAVNRTTVGNATITLNDGNHARFDYTVNSLTQTKNLTRQIFAPPGTMCH